MILLLLGTILCNASSIYTDEKDQGNIELGKLDLKTYYIVIGSVIIAVFLLLVVIYLLSCEYLKESSSGGGHNNENSQSEKADGNNLTLARQREKSSRFVGLYKYDEEA